jgi:hypothetical protein
MGNWPRRWGGAGSAGMAYLDEAQRERLVAAAIGIDPAFARAYVLRGLASVFEHLSTGQRERVLAAAAQLASDELRGGVIHDLGAAMAWLSESHQPRHLDDAEARRPARWPQSTFFVSLRPASLDDARCPPDQTQDSAGANARPDAANVRRRSNRLVLRAIKPWLQRHPSRLAPAAAPRHGLVAAL